MLWLAHVVAMFILAGTAAVGASEPATQPVGSADLLEGLIRELGDRSYMKRVEAERRIREMGPAAISGLTWAQAESRGETAFRVRRLLAELRGDLFTRVKVSLAATPAEVAWDEPFTLLVTFENPTEYDMEIPLAPPPPDRPAPTDAGRQVGGMLDLADWLVVLAPDKKEIFFYLTDIREDEAVAYEVERRLGQAETTVLKARSRQTVELREFNRGWARYRMLREGPYTVQYRWTPEQPDDAARESEICVVSNVAEIRVTRSAPEIIDAAGAMLEAHLKLEGDHLVVRLTNTHDRPLNVHTDIGETSAGFAQVQWRFEAVSEPVGIPEPPPASKPDVPWRKYVELKPAEKLILLRKSVSDFWKLELFKDLPAGSRLEVSAVYANFHCRSTLQVRSRISKAVTPAATKSTGPRSGDADLPPLFVFTGTATSEPVVLIKP